MDVRLSLLTMQIKLEGQPRAKTQITSVLGFAAYGWRSDLSDEEILEKLLSLNLERGSKSKQEKE